MIEPVLFIHILFAAVAVLGGLGSRNFATSLVTGFFTGLLHGGMIALIGAQKGKFEIAELPYLNVATDYVMTNAGAYLTFPDARYVVYLVICGLALLAITVACWIVRFILCSLVCAMLPKRDKAPQPEPAPAPMAPASTAPIAGDSAIVSDSLLISDTPSKPGT